MRIDILIEHIEDSIARSIRHQAWIDKEILDIGGFSSGVMRRLFSNLVHLPKADPVYLECGLYKGGTVCAAMNNSPTLHVYGVEDYSQDFGSTSVRAELEANVEQFRKGARSVTIINADCFTMDLSRIDRPVDVFFYDANHSYEAQRDAIVRFAPLLSDVACILVDDFSWIPVREGTKEGLRLVSDKLNIEKEWMLGTGEQNQPVWHNDVAVYAVSRL